MENRSLKTFLFIRLVFVRLIFIVDILISNLKRFQVLFNISIIETQHLSLKSEHIFHNQ